MTKTWLLLSLALVCAPAEATDVAVTIDDLPVAVAPDLAAEQAITHKLLSGLVRKRITASGFVNYVKVTGPEHQARQAMLRAWLDAGMELGNHGYSHLSFTATPLEQYRADAEKGGAPLEALLAERGEPLRYWRHPFLQTGPSAEARDAFDTWLEADGYTVAPVTLDNADWLFAAVYEDAFARGDTAEAERVARAYLDYSDANFAWQMKAARNLFGRDIAHVLLIHANRLNADHIGQLAAILARHDLNDVPLATALKDPVYARPDTYIGPGGLGWTQRWAMEKGKELDWASQPKIPADIQATFDRLTGS